MEMPSARCIHNPYHQMCIPVPGTTALTGAIHTWKQGVNVTASDDHQLPSILL